MIRVIFTFLLMVTLVAAAPPVAKMTSSETFRLGGEKVPVAGVKDWPLVAGDEVVMGKGPGNIEFQDGSRVYVLPNSRFVVSVTEGRTQVRLREGALAYRFTKDSSVDLAALAHEAVPEGSREGRLAVQDAEAYWNPLEAAFYVIHDEGGERRRAGDLGEVSMRPNPYNLDEIGGQRGYEPDWGTPPDNPGQGVVPPPAATEPGQPAPTSPWRP